MAPRISITAVVVLAAAPTLLSRASPPASATSVPSGRASVPSTAADELVRCGIDMRNVLLNVADGIVLRVRTLDGELVSRAPGKPPVFDDAGSYVLRMKSAEIGMDTPSLNALMARVFTKGSPIKDLKLTIENGRIKRTGKLHKGVDVPVLDDGGVSATSDGRIRCTRRR